MKRGTDTSSEVFTNQQIVDSFFKITNSFKEGDKSINVYQCRCGANRKVKEKTGYSNLMSHITQQHPDYMGEVGVMSLNDTV